MRLYHMSHQGPGELRGDIVRRRQAERHDDGSIRTQREVAGIFAARGMPLSRARIFQLEREAMLKIARGLDELATDPVLQRMAKDL